MTAEQRRLSTFGDFIDERRGSRALTTALVDSERPVEVLSDEVEALRRSRDKVSRAPPIERIKYRTGRLQQTLEHRTALIETPSGQEGRGGRFENCPKVETAGIEPASAAA